MTLAGWKERTGRNGEVPARAITQFTVISALRFGDALAIQDLFLHLRTVLLPLARGIPESREADDVITTFLDDFFLQLPAVNPTVPDVTSYVVAGFRNHLRNVARDETTRHSAYERAASESRSTSENVIPECHSAYSIASANGNVSKGDPPGALTSKLAHHLASENALGNPVVKSRKISGGSWAVDRSYIWDGDQLLLELDASGNRKADYIYYPDTVDQPAMQTIGATSVTATREHRMDASGNVTGTVDGVALSQEVAYDAWGTPTTTGNTDNKLLWKGLIWEGDDVSLYFVRNRWYDPEIGRFVSEDPIGHSGGENLYTFGENDPVNASDPSGMMRCEDYWFVSYNSATRIINGIIDFAGIVCSDVDDLGGGGGGRGPGTPKPKPPSCNDGYRDISDVERNTMLDAARSQIGTLYFRNGGAKSSPSKGFDCSGLIMYCAKSAHIPYTYLETSGMGLPSMRALQAGEQMQPGDIMLFSGHVGLYDPGPNRKGELLSATSHGVRYELPKFWSGLTVMRMRVKC
jgi:RHS repeat-associated protein